MIIRVLKYFTPLVAISIALSIWIFFNERNNISQLQLKDLTAKTNLIVESLNPVISNIYYWSQFDFSDDDFNVNEKHRFEEILGNFMVGMNHYDQFRLINTKGQEVLRLVRTGENKILNDKKLQNKSKRNYFKRTIALDSSTIYISPLNLNEEYGAVEKPYKPIIRGSAPVFSSNGERLGIVVINFNARELLGMLSDKRNARSYIVDTEGNYLANSEDKTRAFEHLTNTKRQHGFKNEYLETWESIRAEQASTVTKSEGFWLANELNFEQTLSKSSLIGGNYAKIETDDIWYLVTNVSNYRVIASAKNFYLSLLIINGICLIIIITVARVETRNEKLKNDYLIELKEKKNRLENQNILLSSIKNRLQLRNRQLKEYNSIVAHNLRAPTTSMSALVSMVNETEDYEDVKLYLPQLSTITKSINTLVQDLLIYVRVLNNDRVKTELIDIEPIIQNSLGLFIDIIDHSVEVVIDLEEWHTINFSKIYFQSVIQNLLSNAVKYHDPEKDSYIKIKSIQTNKNRMLVVEDNGLGIDLEKHGNDMFKLYKRFHRNVSGKGMGLFLIKTQLESLNAEIQVDSELGKGTTFTITFNQNF